MVKFNRKVLKNGLTILHEERDLPVTTVMLGVRYGSAFETADDKGIAHFMEHLCFKGTEKRNAKQIAETLENVGGELNAFTSEEVTAYHVKLPSNHLDLAMDVIFDIFFNPTFPDEEVKREANVICEEMKMYWDNPKAHTLNKIKSNLYEAPFGLDIIGTEKNIRGATRAELLKKHRNIYVPANSILIVVGKNNFNEVVSLAEKFVVDRKGMIPKLPKIVFKKKESSEHRSELNQVNLALGVHFPKLSDKEAVVADVFTSILGEGMSSRLFTEVREKRGLVYGVKSEVDSGKNYGYLIIWAGTDVSKVAEVKEICLREFKKMSNVSEAELKLAKEKVIGGWKIGSEDSRERTADLLLAEIAGDVKDYYNFEEKVNSVSLKDIKKLAEKSDFSFFSIGP